MIFRLVKKQEKQSEQKIQKEYGPSEHAPDDINSDSADNVWCLEVMQS